MAGFQVSTYGRFWVYTEEGFADDDVKLARAPLTTLV
jgi:hypothetical protein